MDSLARRIFIAFIFIIYAGFLFIKGTTPAAYIFLVVGIVYFAYIIYTIKKPKK